MSLESNKIQLSRRLFEKYENLKKLNSGNDNLINILAQYEKNLGNIELEEEKGDKMINTESTSNPIPSHLIHTSNDGKITEITGIYGKDLDLLVDFLVKVLKQTLSDGELKDFKNGNSQIGFLSITLSKKVLEKLQNPIEKIGAKISNILKK